MAQRLKAHTALAEDLDSVSSSYDGQLITAYNSNSTSLGTYTHLH